MRLLGRGKPGLAEFHERIYPLLSPVFDLWNSALDRDEPEAKADTLMEHLWILFDGGDDSTTALAFGNPADEEPTDRLLEISANAFQQMLLDCTGDPTGTPAAERHIAELTLVEKSRVFLASLERRIASTTDNRRRRELETRAAGERRFLAKNDPAGPPQDARQGDPGASKS